MVGWSGACAADGVRAAKPPVAVLDFRRFLPHGGAMMRRTTENPSSRSGLFAANASCRAGHWADPAWGDLRIGARGRRQVFETRLPATGGRPWQPRDQLSGRLPAGERGCGPASNRKAFSVRAMPWRTVAGGCLISRGASARSRGSAPVAATARPLPRERSLAGLPPRAGDDGIAVTPGPVLRGQRSAGLVSRRIDGPCHGRCC